MTDEDKFRALHERVERHEKVTHERFDRHESRLREVERDHAVLQANRTHMDSKFLELRDQLWARLDKDKEEHRSELKDVKGVLKTLALTVIVALIGGVVTFIINGGLSGASP